MSRRRPGAPADLEEVRPNYFVVHNPAAGPVLRSEGVREGDRFLLTTWRREGLIGRLRARGFAVLTLEDQIASLPPLPAVTPPGPPVLRSLAPNEQISFFAAEPLGWRPVPPAAIPGQVSLREGWVIRRRRGRGPPAYYRVGKDGLVPLSESDALRMGYALLGREGGAAVHMTAAAEGWQFPDLPLPPDYRRLLGRIAVREQATWRCTDQSLPLVTALLARLGLRVQTEPA